MQKYKANIVKKIEEKLDSDFILELDAPSSKTIVSLLSRIVKGSELSLKLKAISALEEPIFAKISGGISIESEGNSNFFTFLKTIPLKIKTLEPMDFEATIDDNSWLEDTEFTDALSNLMDDAEISRIVDDSTPPPVPVEEDPEAEWKSLKKGIKKEEDPSLQVSIFNFLNKYYQQIPRKEVDKQLEAHLELDAGLVEAFIVQQSYFFLDLKKHRIFQQSKNIGESVKSLLRDNRNANLEEKVYMYADLDKLILDFGLAMVVSQVRSGNWVIEDDIEDKDIIKLLSKGIITQKDIEELYLSGGIFGIEFEKIVSKKKLTVKDVLAHKKMIEDVQISDDFKQKQQTLWFKANPNSLVFNDDLNSIKQMIDNNEVNAIELFESIISNKDLEVIKKSNKLEFLIKNYQIRVEQVIRYLTNVELFSEESNSIILQNEQIIIDDPLVLFRTLQNPLMKPEAKKALEERFAKLSNKQEQLKMVDEYKQLSETQGIINPSDIIKILDLSDKLYQLSKNYDPSISTGMSLSGPTSDLQYDKDGFEVLSSGHISRVLFQLIKYSPSNNLIEYIYANELIPIEFKIQPILECPACPLKIISHYVAKQEYLYFILKNPILPESILELIVNQAYEIVDYDSILKLVLKHPHCSARLEAKLREGVVQLMTEIRDSKDPQFLYTTFLEVYKHPENKRFSFEITKANQYRLIEACVKNWSAPVNILNYFTQMLGIGDEDVQEIVVSHPNLDLALLNKFVLRLPQSDIVFNAFKKNPNWKDLSIELTKSFFETKQPVTKNIPLIVLDTLQKFNNIDELAQFLNMDANSESFQTLMVSFDDFKLILKQDMLKKYLTIAERTTSIEQLVKMMMEVKNPDFGFFNGMLKISEAERSQILAKCKNNPILSK